MTIIHPMYVHENDENKTITFEINMKAPTALSHARLVHYVEIKFHAARLAVGHTMREERYPFGTIGLRFADDSYGRAKTFCTEKLMENGSPVRELHEEVEEAELPEDVTKDLFWQMSGQPNPYRRQQA